MNCFASISATETGVKLAFLEKVDYRLHTGECWTGKWFCTMVYKPSGLA